MPAWLLSFRFARFGVLAAGLVVAALVAWFYVHSLVAARDEALRALETTKLSLQAAEARARAAETTAKELDRRRKKALIASAEAAKARDAARRELTKLRNEIKAAGDSCETAVDAVRRRIEREK